MKRLTNEPMARHTTFRIGGGVEELLIPESEEELIAIFRQCANGKAPFRVLVGANMPAALVEIGYLSNAEQESQLATAAYQDQVAQALLDALIKFREFVEH